MKRLMWFAVLLWMLYAPRAGEAQELPGGVILEKVACKGDAAQSYALYLPRRYSPDRTWPVLYAFDAGARGILPVQLFQDAAEKFGYIVAGSNVSRNGPVRLVEEALAALLADTESRFSLDSRRVYLAGFSGGARVAVSIGLALKGKVTGVIACGAGFPPSVKPSASVPFAFFGAVGTEDFNFSELEALDQDLARLGLPHRFEIFDGGHEWAPRAVCTHAIEWMELQAMKSGIRARDDHLVAEIFARTNAEAQADEDAGRIYAAYLRLAAAVSDFAGFRDVSAIGSKARLLRRSPAVKRSLAAQKEATEKQQRAGARVNQLIGNALTGGDRALAVQELLVTVSALRKQAEQTKNETDRLAARRVLTASWIQLNEAAGRDFEHGDFKLAALRLEVMAELRPENAQVQYNLARAYARSGNRKDAIAALLAAVTKGFRDAALLEREPDLESLRKEAGFLKIIEDLKKQVSDSKIFFQENHPPCVCAPVTCGPISAGIGVGTRLFMIP